MMTLATDRSLATRVTTRETATDVTCGRFVREDLAELADVIADPLPGLIGEPGDQVEVGGDVRVWHLGAWMRQVPQTPTPTDGCCACGCSTRLIPIGTRVVHARFGAGVVARWFAQDCANVPVAFADGEYAGVARGDLTTAIPEQGDA